MEVSICILFVWQNLVRFEASLFQCKFGEEKEDAGTITI